VALVAGCWADVTFIVFAVVAVIFALFFFLVFAAAGAGIFFTD
jgi:hypothetical protein